MPNYKKIPPKIHSNNLPFRVSESILFIYFFKWTQSQAKQHTTAHPLLFSEMTEKSGRPKARKLVGQDKNSLITEGNRNKKTNYSEAITHRFPQADQCSTSLWAIVTSSKSLFPQFLLLRVALQGK